MKRLTHWTFALFTSLALCSAPLLAADAPPEAKAQAAIEKGLAYLKAQQQPDGGWQQKEEPPAVTAIILRAFLQQPGYDRKTEFVDKGLKKLLTYQLDNGGIYQDLLANYNTS